MLCAIRRSACVFCPTIRAIACLTRARSAVNGVAGAPTPMPATATRSDGSRRSMKALAALAIADRAAEADVRLIDGDDDQAAAGRALVRAVAVGRRPAARRARLGDRAAPTPPSRPAAALPSIRTMKSAGVRSVIGLPLSSTTVTSSDVTSTDDWKLGFGGGCCCCADRTGTAEHAESAEENQQESFSALLSAVSAISAVSDQSFARQRAVALPRAHVVVTVDVDLDLPPRVVARRVGRLVAEQILVRQLVEQIGERARAARRCCR